MFVHFPSTYEYSKNNFPFQQMYFCNGLMCNILFHKNQSVSSDTVLA